MRTRTTSLLLSGGLVLGLVACGGEDEIAEQIIEQASDGSVDIESNDGEITIEGEDGTMTIDPETGEMVIEGADGGMSITSGGELPEDLPEAPRFTGTTVSSAGRIEDNGTITWSINGEIEDPQNAYDALVAELEADGWEIVDNTTISSPEFSAFVTATKGADELFASVSEGEQNYYGWNLTRTAG
jgi:hypothetical protein